MDGAGEYATFFRAVALQRVTDGLDTVFEVWNEKAGEDRGRFDLTRRGRISS